MVDRKTHGERPPSRPALFGQCCIAMRHVPAEYYCFRISELMSDARMELFLEHPYQWRPGMDPADAQQRDGMHAFDGI